MIRPIAVKPTADYKLLLTFSNGEKKLFDVRPYLDMPFFSNICPVSAEIPPLSA